MMRSEQIPSEFKADHVDFSPSTNWKGEVQREKISGYDTAKFTAKGSLNMHMNKKDYLETMNFKEFKEWEDYFAYTLEHSIMKNFHFSSKPL